MKKRFLVSFVALAFIAALLSGFGANLYNANAQGAAMAATASPTLAAKSASAPVAVQHSAKVPKYVFLFIGDGMSYPQIQSASYYLGAVKSKGGVESVNLSFMDFPVAGSAKTYDRTSFAPDSSSTATSIATGYKTYSGVLNMDTTYTISYEAISEKLKKQKGYKVGVITSVNLNHATPAAFYAHQPSRGNLYEIGLELVKSNFDYFAGGMFLKPTGKDKDKKDILELAERAGYKVVTTYAESEKVTAADGKTILIAENRDSSDAMNYSLDAKKGEWSLAAYVKKGIEMLKNDKGFFMMVEGGKIDWAGHANDAGANIHDTLAFSDAVAVAKEFYKAHPNETLIIVTGDHETGGMTIGYAGTNYDTFLTNLAGQSITYEDYSNKIVPEYKKNNTPFKEVLKDVKALFGLITSDDPAATKGNTLVLTDYEYEVLKKAYTRTMKVGESSQSKMTQEEYVLYGTYDPLTVTITHLLNNKSGLGFTTYSHTGLPVPVFTIGVGSEQFAGYYENTDIFSKMAKLTGVK